MLFSSDPVIHYICFDPAKIPPKDSLIHFESDHQFDLIRHESVLTAQYIFCSYYVLAFKVFPLGGWGGPEKDQILWHCLVHGLAIIHHPVQVSLQGAFQGQVQVSLVVVQFLWSGDPIMLYGVVPGQCSVNHYDSSF